MQIHRVGQVKVQHLLYLAMPDEFKYDEDIDIYTKYKRYIASKPWVKDNYLRMPEKVSGLGLIPFSLCLLGTLCVIVVGYFHGHMNIGAVWQLAQL